MAAGVDRQDEAISDDILAGIAALKAAADKLHHRGYLKPKVLAAVEVAGHILHAKHEGADAPVWEGVAAAAEHHILKELIKEAVPLVLNKAAAGGLVAAMNLVELAEGIAPVLERKAFDLAASHKRYLAEKIRDDDHLDRVADAAVVLDMLAVGARGVGDVGHVVRDAIHTVADPVSKAAKAFVRDLPDAMAEQVEYEARDAALEAEVIEIIGRTVVKGGAAILERVGKASAKAEALQAMCEGDMSPEDAAKVLNLGKPSFPSLPKPTGLVADLPVFSPPPKKRTIGLKVVMGAAGAAAIVPIVQNIALVVGVDGVTGVVTLKVAVAGAAVAPVMAAVAVGAAAYGVYEGVRYFDRKAEERELRDGLEALETDVGSFQDYVKCISGRQRPLTGRSSVEKKITRLSKISRTDEQKAALALLTEQYEQAVRQAEMKQQEFRAHRHAVRKKPGFMAEARKVYTEYKSEIEQGGIPGWGGLLACAGEVEELYEKYDAAPSSSSSGGATASAAEACLGSNEASMDTGAGQKGGAVVLSGAGLAYAQMLNDQAMAAELIQTWVMCCGIVAGICIGGGLMIKGLLSATDSVCAREEERVEIWKRNQRYLDQLKQQRDRILEVALLCAEQVTPQVALDYSRAYSEQKPDCFATAFVMFNEPNVASVLGPLVPGGQKLRQIIADELMGDPVFDRTSQDDAKLALIIALESKAARDHLQSLVPKVPNI
jgi:hypothetical protein